MYVTIILPVVYYGYKISSLAWKEHRMRVSENGVLRTIFGPKRDDGTRGWRKLHYEDFHTLYSSFKIVKKTKSWRMRCA
jgi:hypothetical protein